MRWHHCSPDCCDVLSISVCREVVNIPLVLKTGRVPFLEGPSQGNQQWLSGPQGHRVPVAQGPFGYRAQEEVMTWIYPLGLGCVVFTFWRWEVLGPRGSAGRGGERTGHPGRCSEVTLWGLIASWCARARLRHILRALASSSNLKPQAFSLGKFLGHSLRGGLPARSSSFFSSRFTVHKLC